jgi:predicted ATPase
VHISRVGFRNFRSIGEEPVILDLTKKVNVLIGPNNAGKSTVISACERLWLEKFNWKALGELDRHKRQVSMMPGMVVDGDWRPQKPEKNSDWPADCSGEFVFDLSSPITFRESPFHKLTDWGLFNRQMRALTNKYFQSPVAVGVMKEHAPELAKAALQRLTLAIPKVIILPAFRRITDGDYAFDGSGIVNLLDQWRNPIIGREPDEEKFVKVREFLRHLIQLPNATLEVPRGEARLVVRRDGLRLPLENYGTGVHQLIILAVAVLQHEEHLIAIEEPEIHFHPRLQRDLLRFLIDETKNQYLIATHSPAFLSRPRDCHIVRLWLENGATRSEAVETTATALEVLRDLGVSAADIMQTRFVIWVEGPSDRVYLRHWIDLAYAEGITKHKLLEGIDYSIVFYGGRCLSHLSVERDDIAEDEGDSEAQRLIEILRVNQHAAVVIDSDRQSTNDSINATKTRIKTESEQSNVLCWITAGREVENYLPASAVAAAAAEQIGGEEVPLTFGQWHKLEDQVQKAVPANLKRIKCRYERDKPMWARRIVRHISSLDGSDLRQRVQELVNAIVRAQGPG